MELWCKAGKGGGEGRTGRKDHRSERGNIFSPSVLRLQQRSVTAIPCDRGADASGLLPSAGTGEKPQQGPPRGVTDSPQTSENPPLGVVGWEENWEFLCWEKKIKKVEFGW